MKYAGHEWIVKDKKKKKYQLVRRQVVVGHTIWAPKEKIKLADQTWRSELRTGDPINLFIGGIWTSASVLRREGSTLCIQPCFNNFTIRLNQNSGKISKMQPHNYPLWKEDVVSHVFFNENLRVERGKGLMFPWEYGKGITVIGPQRKHLLTLKFAPYNTQSFPLEMYNDISTEEILWDICTRPQDHPRTVVDIANQYCAERQSLYPLLPQSSIEHFIDKALAQNDNRRVAELLSVGNKVGLFSTNEWAVFNHLSCPYIDVEIRFTTHLEMDLFWSGVHMQKLTEKISTILTKISRPIPYKPELIEIDHSPEMQYALSRMLGMEREPLQALHLRKVNNHHLTSYDGFCKPALNKFGGIINMYGLDYISLVTNLVERSPLKTLVIVEPDSIHMWSAFSIWYGRDREDGNIIVTTRNTFIRCWTAFPSVRRLICFALPSANTVFENTLKTFSCKIRWAVCTSSNEDKGWNLLQERPNDLARIFLNKQQMEDLGVLFPIISKRKVICDCDHKSYKDIIINTQWMSRNKTSNYIAKFLLHPELVPSHIRGEKLSSFEATLDCIAQKVNLKKEVLKNRTEEKCAVCLETISNPIVTSCGHVFCEACAEELDTRNINCPMCRSNVSGYIKVSDKNTPGNIVMHNGHSFRLPEKEEWGQKFHFLKKYPKATFVTKYASVKRKLKKHFSHTQIVTEKALANGTKLNAEQIIMIDAGISTHWLDNAWGKDIELIQIIYKINI